MRPTEALNWFYIATLRVYRLDWFNAKSVSILGKKGLLNVQRNPSHFSNHTQEEGRWIFVDKRADGKKI